MNKHVILLTTMALLFSCAKEPVVNEVQPAETITFTAGWADSEETRTVLQSDGTSVWWTPGEEIMVYYGNKFSGKFTSTNTESQALTSFSGSLSVLTGTVEEGNGSQSFIAVYPYDAAVACDGEKVTLVVPSVQTAVSGTFADNLFPAIAKSSNLDLAFYNVCGGVRFSVSQAGILSVTFKSNDGKALAGKVKVGFDSHGLPELMSVDSGNYYVKVSAPDGGFVPGEYYFAALLPRILSRGLSMTFETASEFATYSAENCITVNRSRFGKLDEKDKDLLFEQRIEFEAVDMGLSVKWASFNIGASSPEEYGDYYAWGETEPYYSSQDPLIWKEGKEAGYEWPSYKWCMGTRDTFIKYCDNSDYGYNGFTDTKTVLDPEDDVAHVNLGDNWRMPTQKEWKELRENCTWTWTTQNGTIGYLVTANNGNSIFLPAAGRRTSNSRKIGSAGSYGFYRLSSYFEGKPSYPYATYNGTFNSSVIETYGLADRRWGHSIRPVYAE